MKELILVRHGQADHEINSLTGGWTDSHLTPLGKRQAEATGQALMNLLHGRPALLISSDLPRARETTDILAKFVKLTPQFSTGLRELCNGRAAGQTRDGAKQIELPVTHPTVDWVPYPEAESWRAMTQRVHSCLDSIADKEELAIIVAHGNSGIAVVHWWLQLEEKAWSTVSFQLDNCSITHLSINGWGERTICRMNDVSHLFSC